MSKELVLDINDALFCKKGHQIKTTLNSSGVVFLFDKLHGACVAGHFSEVGEDHSDHYNKRYSESCIHLIVNKLASIGLDPKLLQAKVITSGNTKGKVLLENAINECQRMGIEVLQEKNIESKSCELLFDLESSDIFSKKVHKNLTPKVENSSSFVRRVLVVDDSPTMQKLLERILNQDPLIEVVGLAKNSSEAEEMFEKFKPDLMTLDIHMPGERGDEFLKRHFHKMNIPIMILSSLDINDSRYVFDALQSGAIDYMKKPDLSSLDSISEDLKMKIKEFSSANLTTVEKIAKQESGTFKEIEDVIIGIGSSTGGTNALEVLLRGLPSVIPPILIAQHIPKAFSGPFACRLNSLVDFSVKEAEEGDLIKPNQVLIAPGGQHLSVIKKGSSYVAKLLQTDKVNRHRPSVDVLFDSLAKVQDQKLIGILLTGMGSDGANGLLRLRNSGAFTIAQDEKSSVVYGMPRVAKEIGAAECISSLKQIPKILKKKLT